MGAVDVAAVAAFERLARFVGSVEGEGLACAVRQRDVGDRDWLVALEWGKEAEDSPMVAAAAYGTGATVDEAVHQALDDTRTARVPDGDRAEVLYEAYRGAREGVLGVPAVVWTELTPDARRVWHLMAAVHVGVSPMGPLARTAVGHYLDGAIRQWRINLADAKEPGGGDGDAAARSVLVAECYIDAFQSVRSSLLGETLPVEDGGHGVPAREAGVAATLEREEAEAPFVMGASSAELIQYFQRTTTLPAAVLEAAIPAAIDAVYAARDQQKDMHRAGAEAAVAALEAEQRLDRVHDGLTAEQWASRARRAEKALLKHCETIRRHEESLDRADRAFDVLAAAAALGLAAALVAVRRARR